MTIPTTPTSNVIGTDKIVPNIIVKIEATAKEPNTQESFSLIMTNIKGIGKKKNVTIPNKGNLNGNE